MKRLNFLFIAVFMCLCATAQTATDAEIVSHITENGVNTIVQPEALNRLLKRVKGHALNAETQNGDADDESTARDRNAGYRVQVFSDNRPAAKGEARTKGRAIAERFPSYRTYIKYTSPYWRLRVGDFRTRREAEDAAEAIRQAFPSYSREVRVVADRITISATQN